MTVSIVSIFKDEAKYLKEWIEFHLMVGVDKFYLTNNLSQDNYLEVLNPYIEDGIVVIKDLPINTSNEAVLVRHWINNLNQDIVKSKEDWVIHISVDEFLFPTEKLNIKDVLSSFDDNVGQILVNWVVFGNSNYTLKNGEFLIEHLKMSSLPEFIGNLHVKSIIKKEAYSFMPSVHYCNIKQPFKTVDSVGDGTNCNPHKRHETKKHINNGLIINHYKLRDLSWTNKKIEWYKMWGGRPDGMENLYNDTENLNIQRFVPELKKRLQS